MSAIQYMSTSPAAFFRQYLSRSAGSLFASAKKSPYPEMNAKMQTHSLQSRPRRSSAGTPPIRRRLMYMSSFSCHSGNAKK